MKHKIPLTPHNIKILTEKYNIPREQLTREYWIKVIMSDPAILLPLLNNHKGPVDPQRRIRNRAGKMIKHTIRQAVGLPTPHHNTQRQRQYLEIVRESGLIQ